MKGIFLVHFDIVSSRWPLVRFVMSEPPDCVSGRGFVFLVFAALPVAHRSSLMSHLGSALCFGTTCPRRNDSSLHGLKPNKMHAGLNRVNNAAARLHVPSLQGCVNVPRAPGPQLGPP